ncbi:hypothetical protein LSTR_LSTR005676 [Laodelphax striatellus]|uniref:Uncharacterized protein n=1 Tax=Laodelphax striatellus TaxID=195883 RepID=A0A482X8W0_LAOST|nr:hypothetical protein LSTR_LSTR005676 [Laodelphax striatellus]
MYTQDSDNIPAPTFLQEIRILFSNYDSNLNYEVIDENDIDILLPNYRNSLPESQAYKIEKHDASSSIIFHYVKEIQRITNSGVVKKLKTFLAEIICESQKAEVKFFEIDERFRKTWEEDKVIVTCSNQKSLDSIKSMLNHLCFTREMVYESEANLKDLLGKYVDEETRTKILKKLYFVEEKEEKHSRRMDQKLMSEIIRLELEEFISRLSKLVDRLNMLLIENQKLADQNFWLKEKIHTVYKNKILLDYDELVNLKERKKLKPTLNDLQKELLKLRQNLKVKEPENSRLLDEVTSAGRHLDSEKLNNLRVYNDISLELVYVSKMNRLGESKLAKAIDLGAELLEDISKISDHLTKIGFKIQKFTKQNTSKDCYFVDCIEAGREFINKLFVQVRILMDKIPNLENNLGGFSGELDKITGDVMDLKREKSELKKEIVTEKMELEKTMQISKNCFPGEELLQSTRTYSARSNQSMKFYKINYELSEKLIQAETCCNDLVLKLEDADNEKDNLKMTIEKQGEMLRENQRIIDELKGENVALKTRNDDLMGSLIASIVLLYFSKRIVGNWIEDNKRKQSKVS